MIDLVDFAGFICDFIFAYLCFSTVEKKSTIKNWRRLVAIPVILLTFPLYPIGFLTVMNSAWMRFIIRIVVYICYLLIAQGVTFSIALYASAFFAAVCTISHNLFLTPLTDPLLRGWIPFTSIPTINHILSTTIVIGLKVAIYTYVYWALPLRDIKQVGIMRAAILSTFILVSLYLKATQLPITYGGVGNVVEISIYFIILQVSLLLCLIIFEKYQRKQHENMVYRLQMATAQNLLNNIHTRQERDDAICSLKHDLKNHMITLRNLIKLEQDTHAVKYIDDFIGRIGRDEVRFHSGNHVLDGLMEEKLSLATNNNIALNVIMDFRRGHFIENFDLCIIMGNALDNAIESCLQIPEKADRYIDVKGGVSANCLIIRIANSSTNHILMEGDLPRTTKTNLKDHGFGLINCQNTLHKYNGTLSAIVEGGESFVLSILIPIPDDKNSYDGNLEHNIVLSEKSGREICRE